MTSYVSYDGIKWPWNKISVLFLPFSQFSRSVMSETLCDPMDCNPPGSSVHGILQAGILEWVANSFSRSIVDFVIVQSLSRVRLFATPWTAARQASLSITSSQSLLKLMSIESVMLSSHLILCRPLLLLPPIPPSIRDFSNESTLHMRWPNYWSFQL